ncbi:hypothetical protein EKN56_19130 [Limnobaculum zhutongyuii]|uniref:Uncharacterized protein n=1 Tax=Limnobaculum zhutongyuii TaxID=2498113 RepID=A0A411WQ51_9GAMM|nr:hypothetical protein [Limnobaculum zhutongyuii]QBH98318.1 hypothetical protein EKN56_19130 [Limnobaculum zhutongyuii]TQS89785.1 hypothetical protein ELQ32_05110 [Limnobaculum zhutongyuii]
MKHISVPISKAAMARLDLDACIAGDLIEFYLSEEAYKVLWKTGVIEQINKALNIMIDDFEDEKLLSNERLLHAQQIIESKLVSTNCEILQKLLTLVNSALKHNTGIFFYF